MLSKAQAEFDVIVVGGGPSGMMAAGIAAARGKKVLLLEKNVSLGEKLKITGGGRCNITNAEFDKEKLLSHYGAAKDFLYSPFSQFGVQDTFDYFQSRGLPLVIEANNRAFPQSSKALDVFRVLESELKKYHVKVVSQAPVSKVLIKNSKIEGVAVGDEEYFAPSVILATGGLSHPETGATGDGFQWLRDLGHTIKQPSPNLVPLKVAESWVKKLAGVSPSAVKVTFFLDGARQFSRSGKILFTHFGLSGPLILNSASNVQDLLRAGVVTAEIDTHPTLNIGELEKRVIEVFDNNKNKSLKNILPEIVPAGTANAILTILPSLDPDKKVHSITKDERKTIVCLIKALPLTITGLLGFEKAIISDGGLPLEEVDTRTMRSRKIENLYITGDLLNIKRPSGGFSLQLCWTTGYVAGLNA